MVMHFYLIWNRDFDKKGGFWNKKIEFCTSKSFKTKISRNLQVFVSVALFCMSFLEVVRKIESFSDWKSKRRCPEVAVGLQTAQKKCLKIPRKVAKNETPRPSPVPLPFDLLQIASPFRTIKEGYFGSGKMIMKFHDVLLIFNELF